ncbi:MAG: methionyl-tRNA formyltransferase [Planctomycetia bacterium]|nr:methionyl-tRNA formyltransferase [Planctomycetia bacterium]
MRIVMFATGPFAAPSFRAIYATRHQVMALVTQPLRGTRGKGEGAPSPLRAVAAEHGTPIFDPEDVNTVESRGQIASLRPDLFIVTDYGQILADETLALPRAGAINLHGSLLPKYRGAAPINWAVYHGETETGVSVIGLTSRVDAGPVYAQASSPIGPEETPVDIEPRLAELGAPLVCRVIDQIEHGTAKPLPQDPAAASRARRLGKTDGAIDWSRSAGGVKNQVRAMQPWPRAYTYLKHADGEPLRLIIGEVACVPAPRPGEPGEVLAATKHEIVVAAGEGAVQIVRLQAPGRQMITASEFLRGHPLVAGQRFTASEKEAP